MSDFPLTHGERPSYRIGGKLSEGGRPSTLGRPSTTGRPSTLGRPSMARTPGEARPSDAQAVQTAAEIGRLSEGPGALLMARNREMTELRDELLRTQQRLDEMQAKNKSLLEESSELDSEVFAQNNRAASSEQALAQLFSDSQCLEQSQIAVAAEHSERMNSMRDELEVRVSRREAMSAEAAAQRERAARSDSELETLQSLIREEESVVEELRTAALEVTRAHDAESPGVGLSTEASARHLDELNSKANAHRSEAVSARDLHSRLECEHEAERERHDALTGKRSKIAAALADRHARARRLESTLQARGCTQNLDTTHASVEAILERARIVQSEYSTCESQIQSLHETLTKSKGAGTDSVNRLQEKLDKAREDLQASLRDVSAAHSDSVVKLEDEIHAERQRASEEASAERSNHEMVASLRTQKTAAQLRQDAALSGTSTDVGRRGTIETNLRDVRNATSSAEQRTERAAARAAELASRKFMMEREGEARIARLRALLEELWAALAASAQRRRPLSPHGRWPTAA
eukprot:TRINITY_DN38204_c0_g1_i1.p1 TRINITY_DN38204_c0_g1~~TRINITY_DN38204_c0_g1_i1.p1  ORF type:complete len:524 (-),score=69.42 TRINITY_DN38204_c0_g1_i1:199-1770(-)